MILSGHSKLADSLVAILARQPELSAADLHNLASKPERSYSLAAIYKELAKLKTQGIVVKQKDRFSLSLTWLFELQEFVDRVGVRYRNQDFLSTFLPGAVGKHSWSFSNLMSMDDFWNQILLALVSNFDGRSVLSWVPHPWFVLIHTEKERKLHSALRRLGRHFFTIFGGDAYLDHLAEKLYQKNIHTYSFAPGPFAKQVDTYLDVVGDYVLTVKIEGKLVSQIEKLFSSIRGRRDLDPLAAMEVLAAPAKIRMTLEKNSRLATTLRRKFEDYFGVSDGNVSK
jgi:hypothetical protein